MKLELDVDVLPLFQRLEKGERRLAYAVVNAIRNTALRVQAGEVEHARRVFVIRKTAFMLGTPARPGGAVARITTWPNVKASRPYAEIEVGTNAEASNRRLLLRAFERGGERRPFTPGAKSVAVPLLGRPARPGISRQVPYEYTFAGLHFVAYFRGRRLAKRRGKREVDSALIKEYGRVSLPEGEQSVQFRGRNRTFILTHTRRAPFGGVFQRIGRGRDAIREIYAFRRGDRMRPVLEFVATAQRVAHQWFHEELQRQAAEALSRGRLAS